MQVFPLRERADGRPLLRSTSRTPPATTRSRCSRGSASSTTARRRRCRRRSSCRAGSATSTPSPGFLSELRGSRVEVRAPERGEKRRLQELAQHNAELALSSDTLDRRDQAAAARRGARGAARGAQPRVAAAPDRVLRHLEHRRGRRSSGRWSSSRTASPRRPHYRKFAVRGQAGQDDFAAMAEVVSRRFARLAAGPGAADYDESFAATPNLVVIDGGKGQLGAALEAMARLRPAAGRGDLAGEAGRGGLPARALRAGAAARPLAGAAAAAAAPRRGAPVRDHLPPLTTRRRRARVDVRPARRCRADAQARASAPLRLRRARALGLAGGARGVPGVPAKTARSIYAQLHRAGRA